MIDRRKHPRPASARETLRDLAYDSVRQAWGFVHAVEALDAPKASRFLAALERAGAIIVGASGPRLALTEHISRATIVALDAGAVREPHSADASAGLSLVSIAVDPTGRR